MPEHIGKLLYEYKEMNTISLENIIRIHKKTRHISKLGMARGTDPLNKQIKKKNNLNKLIFNFNRND